VENVSGRLAGKHAIVTGAARGIGRAIATRFLDEGAALMLCDVRRDALDEVRAELGARGTVLAMPVDVTDRTAVEAMVGRAREELGSIDVLANNAGIAGFTPFLELGDEEWRRMLDVDLTGVFICAQAVARVMREQRSGAIVNMASTNGLRGEALEAHYNAAKGGVVLLTRTMAIELAPFGIRVNSVCPGSIATDLAPEAGMTAADVEEYHRRIPMGRSGTPAEVAAAFAFLASDDASFVTGTELVVDGGQICQE
jgi:3-oxoacyl-[acyl-carrier protein] reductase